MDIPAYWAPANDAGAWRGTFPRRRAAPTTTSQGEPPLDKPPGSRCSRSSVAHVGRGYGPVARASCTADAGCPTVAPSHCGRNRTLPVDLAGICPLAGLKRPLGGLKSPLGALKEGRADIVDDEGEATTAPGTSARPGSGFIKESSRGLVTAGARHSAMSRPWS